MSLHLRWSVRRGRLNERLQFIGIRPTMATCLLIPGALLDSQSTCMRSPHDHGCVAHLESDLRQLDSAFHHLERTIEHIEEDSFRGHCRIHGSTVHLRRLMHSMELNIHYLQDDVRVLNRVRHRAERVSPVRPFGHVDTRLYNSWPGYHRGGITIGGGSSRFTIRF